MYDKATVQNMMQDVVRRETEVRSLEQKLKTAKEHLESARGDVQYNCPHDFALTKGYEHEGGVCRLCRINELYVPQFKALWEKAHPAAKQLSELAGKSR